MAEERKAKKTSILDLSKYMDKAIRVKFSGGREVAGVLKGKLILFLPQFYMNEENENERYEFEKDIDDYDITRVQLPIKYAWDYSQVT